jgi:hypothetical protein
MKLAISIFIFTLNLANGYSSNSKQIADRESLIETNLMETKNMDKQDFTTTILVEQTPREVFNAISNVRGWWSENIDGSTDKLNSEFFYHYKDVHLCKMKIVELVPAKKIVWLVTDNYFSFTKDKTEWKGTKIIFEISKQGDKTQLRFMHQGLVPQYECYKVCNEAWSNYINNSLFSLITIGKGQPSSKEDDGFDRQLIEKWKLKTE